MAMGAGSGVSPGGLNGGIMSSGMMKLPQLAGNQLNQSSGYHL